MRQLVSPVVLSLVACVTLAAQSSQQPQVFRSGVDLVRFDLSVTDENGNPLPDVRPDEIEIVEDGRPRPIVLFQRVQEPAGFYADAAVRAASAEVTSNEATPRGHLYIFVFDQEHITSDNEQRARDAAATFIRRRVRASDRVAIYGLPGTGPQLSFTADQQRAIAELQKVRGGYDPVVNTPAGTFTVDEAYQIAAGNPTVADAVTRRVATDLSSDTAGSLLTQTGNAATRGARLRTGDEDYGIQLRLVTENARTLVQQQDAIARDFLLRLSDLMARFRNVEGRKTIVLFSEGFHDPNVSRELQDVAAAAAESYSVFYALDLNRRLADLQNATPSTTAPATGIQQRTAPLASLALETDGVFVTDATAHLDDALARIANESQDYYIAGFLPSEKALAERGSYRRVTVRVKRPGARVSARTGYALPSNTTPPDRRVAIDAALAAPFSQQALKVAYTTYLLRSGTSGRARVVLSLGANLPLRDDTHSTADVVFVARDVHDGRVVASGTDTMPLPDTAQPGGYLGHGTYHVQFEVPPGSYMMRAVVREPGGLLGSADRRLDVRDVSGPSVAASDLVLGSADGTLPVRAQAYIQDGLTGALEIYGRSPEQLAHVSVLASLAPESGGAAHTVTAAVAEADNTGGGAVRRATFSVPLTDVPVGAYVARAVVRDGNDEVATIARQVDVVEGNAPAAPVPAVDPRNVAHGPLFARAEGEWMTSPPSLASHAKKGFELFTKGDFSSAAAELQQAFDGNTASAATAFVLGWAWEGTGDHLKAIGAWRAAAVADPSLVPVHLALADEYVRLANPALAVQALRAGLAARPDSVELKTKLEQIVGSR
ncbi:MAG TPA: VWA domain-containing protein [Vicinamibacterales bacterium]|jgi:VWFA-related protein